MEYVIAVDLGATNIRTALVTSAGKIVERKEQRTKVAQGYKVVIHQIKELIWDMIKKARVDLQQIRGIGVGSPGPLNTKTGVIIDTPNLGWKNVGLKDAIEDEFRLPTYVDNDGNLAALGEKWLGAGKEVENLVCLTLGSGIGGGIISQGEIFHGSNDAAGELGHIIVEPEGLKCGCGNYGCMEAYAAGPSMVKRTILAIKEGRKTQLGTADEISPALIYQAALQKDELASQIIKDTGRYLGIGIVSIVNVLNPELIIIGGRVSQMGEMLLNYIKEEVTKRAYLLPAKNISIVLAQLGDDAGIIGASKMVWRNYHYLD